MFPKLIKRIRLRTWIAMGVIFILLPIIFIALYKPAGAGAAWFNDQWRFRKSINIPSHTALETNVYVTSPTFDATDTTKFQSDCGDIRFTKEDGELLPFYVVACTASASMHVFFDSLPAGQTNYYMYYGNPSAADGFVTADFATAATGLGTQTLGSEALAPSPNALWRFDEAVDNSCSGGINDACNSANSNTALDGAISNGTAWKSSDLCLSGNCLYFDGSNDVVTVTTSNPIQLNGGLSAGFTFEAWIRTNGAGEGSGGRIFYKGTSTWLRVDTLSTGKLDIEASVDLATTDATLNVSQSVTNNQWTHVAVSYTDDGDDELTIWVNGKNAGSSTNGVGSLASDTNDLLIGGDSSNNFAGFIDEFKVYPTERSSTQIYLDSQGSAGSKGSSSALGAANSAFLNNGLVGYWKMDESSWTNDCSTASVTDSSGNGNNLTSCPNSTGPTGGNVGKFGWGGTFDGSDDYVEIANNSILKPSTNMTISAWFKLGTLSPGQDGVIVEKKNSSTPFLSYNLYFNDTNNVLCMNWYNTGASQTQLCSNTALSASVWYNVVGTIDPLSGASNIYINGIKDNGFASGTASGTIFDSDDKFRIGASSSISTRFNGTIDEVRIYNRTLTSSEASNIYNWGPKPDAYYSFDALGNSVPKNGGMLAYADGANDDLKYRILDASGNWGTAGTLPDVDTGTTDRRAGNVFIYSSPTRNEKIVLSSHFASNVTYVYAEIWDGNAQSWINDGVNAPKLLTSWTSSDQNPEYVGGDYLGDGRFLAVVSDGTTTPKAYFWSGTSWGSSVSTTSTGADTIATIEVRARPGTSEAMIVIVDTGNDVNTLYYDGSGETSGDFTLHTEHTATAAGANRIASFTWSANNPLRGEMSYTNATSDTTPVVNVFTADGAGGGSWGTANQGVTIGNNNAQTQIVARPGNNSFVPCWMLNASAINCLEERDNDTTPTLQTTTNQQLVATTDSTGIARTFSVAYEQQSAATGIAVYSDATAIPKLKKYTAGTTTWDSSATSLTDQGHSSNIRAVDLIAEPSTDDIMILTRDQAASRSVRTVVWDGTNNAVYTTNGRTSTEQSTNSGGASVNHSAFFAWDNYVSNDTVYDRSGNGLNAALRGQRANFGSPSKFGNALSLNGTNSYTYLYDNSNFDFAAAEQFTIGAWIKTSSTGTKYIFSKADATNGGYKLYEDASGNLCFGIDDDATWTPDDSACSSGTSFADGNWHFLEAQKDATTSIKIYVDGVLRGSDSSIAATATLANAGAVIIGADADGSSPWKGQIDELRVYRYLRSAQQITEDLNGGHATGGSPIASQVAWWKFDEVQGQTINSSNSTVSLTAVRGTTSGSESQDFTWTVTCEINGCGDYDGTDDVTTVTSATAIDFDDNLHDGFTFSAWINPDAVGEGSAGEIFNKNTSTYCRLGGSTPFNITCSVNEATDATLTVNSVIPSGTWTHVAVSFTDDADDELTIWINGKPAGSSTNGVGPLDSDAATSLLIGGGTSNNFDGKIDDFKIYNSELTAAQMQIDYNANAGINFGTKQVESAQLTDGTGSAPVGIWNLDENTGTTAADTSGTGNTGTLTGSGGLTTPAWTVGKIGPGLDFTPLNSYVSVTSSTSLNITGDITIEAWAKPVQDTGVTRFVLGKGLTSPTTSRQYEMVLTTGNQWQVRTYIGSSTFTTTDTTTTPSTSRWDHVVLQRSGTNLNIYVNGVLRNTTGSVSGSLNTTSNDFAIGRAGGSGASYFAGLIDQVVIYNYARTASQIAYDYSRGLPFAWWKFDECQGSTANDSGTGANNLTITIGAAGSEDTIGTCTTSSTSWGNGQTGKFNGSLDYDGNDDYSSCTDASCGGTKKLDFGASAKFSFGAWVKTSTSGAQMILTKKSNDQASTAGYMTQLSSSNFGLCRISDGTTQVSPTGTTALNDGNWHHLMCVSDGSTLKTYVDGKQEASSSSTSVTGSLDNSSDVRVADQGSGGSRMDGQIDNVRIYNYDLSASQVKKLYNGDAGARFGPATGSP